MKCKHCKFVYDDSLEKCPNCGKSNLDEVVKDTDDIDLPMTKEEATGKLKKIKEEIPEEIVEETKIENEPTKAEEDSELEQVVGIRELSEEDKFITNFIKKDDALEKMKETVENEKGNTGMIVARIAAFISVLFFAGVMYYSKVILPKTQSKSQQGGVNEIIDTYNPTGTTTLNNTTGHIEIKGSFGDETIMTQLKKNDYDYNKDMTIVDITMDFGTLSGGQTFKMKMHRTLNTSSAYEDEVTFEYQGAKINGIIRSYNSYNEDLITNMINSYVINEFDGGVVIYTKASTFQLGQPQAILIVKDGRFSKMERVITTYSLDGVSITQCPVTLTGNTITYCGLQGDFKKGENVEIRKYSQTIEGPENILETLNAMVSK